MTGQYRMVVARQVVIALLPGTLRGRKALSKLPDNINEDQGGPTQQGHLVCLL